MSNELKITVIGAGSEQFAQGLIHDIVLEKDLWSSREVQVVFVDLNADALGKSVEYARKCVALTGATVQFTASTDRNEALPGSHFVLVAIAVERMDLWEQDFRVPIAYGMKHIYGENGGPWALFHALRNMKIIMPICADVQRLCPDALLLNFTNPEARILTAILTLTEVNAAGLCHGFYDFHNLVYRVLGREPGSLDIRTAGMNHFFTHYHLSDRETGEDLRGEFASRINGDPEALPPLVRWFWERFGVLGYNSDHHVGEYIKYGYEYADQLWLFGNENRKIFRSEEPVTTRAVYNAWVYGVDPETYLNNLSDYTRSTDDLAESDVAHSGELAIPIIADISLDRENFRSAVNTLNGEGYISNLDRAGCIEVPAVVNGSGIHPEFVGALPEGFAAQIRLQHSIQLLLAEAYREKSKHLLLQALLLDPVVDSSRQAEKMLDYMLELQAEYLPVFT